MSFVNLYYKSEYSLLKSSCSLHKTFKLLSEYGYQSIALTDEGSMYGTIKFYKEAKKYNIKPIIGLKITYSFNEVTTPILLYAMNNFGYRNLMRLSSLYKINKQKISIDDFARYGQGVLVIIPFFESILFTYYLNHKFNILFEHFEAINACFDEAYIGLSKQSEIEKKYISDVFTMFSARHIKLVAIHKISYLNDGDQLVYQTLRSIEKGGELYKISEHETNEYLLTPSDAEKLFEELPGLTEETKRISDKCNVTIEFNKYFIPSFDSTIDANSYLKELAYKGLKKRLTQNNVIDFNPYVSRLSYELDVIQKMQFSDYFLIVWDFIKYAKTNNIYVGPGRGSAPASLVCYALGISDVDPIKYNLLFERFLNPERISMPDIDTDFPDNKRDEVIKYVSKKYGDLHVAHIATFGTFKAKLALRDTTRVLKLSDAKLNEINKILNKYSLKDLYSKSLSEIIEHDEMLLRLMDDYEEISEVLTIASSIEGLPRNLSTHAAGIIITKNELVAYTPLDEGIDGIYQTQYEASDLESLGLLKMDFLGLRNLTIIDEAIKLIKKDFPQFVMDKSTADVQTYKMLAKGDVSGVFQLESAGMKKVLMDLRVSNFSDITSAIALYRPGPMDIIPHFINRKFKREQVVYPHPDLEEILKDTYGMIVYQDQILLIARKFAGYSYGRADILRRAVSKKKLDALNEERSTFISSSLKRGYDEKTANEIYDYIVKFASYGFNKAHSVAYAMLSYQTAYLKCHYPQYFYATLLSQSLGSDTDILKYIQDAKKRQIALARPNINLSGQRFEIINGKIIFPLTIIRGLGYVKVEEIIKRRNEALFSSFEDFIKRTKDILSSNLFENVIYSGALDEFKLSKKAMIETYQTIIDRMSYDFVSDIILPEYDQDEFSYKHLQTSEKQAIGINLLYNFANKYRYLYESYHLQKISDASNYKMVRLLGFIEQKKIIKTKNFEDMAFMTLSDDLQSIDLILFPQAYQKYKEIKEGDLVIVSGKTEERTKIQLVVDEIRKV